MKDLNTRKLKREYWKWLRKYWRWYNSYDYHVAVNGPAGFKPTRAHVNHCMTNASAAKAELIHRGYLLP